MVEENYLGMGVDSTTPAYVRPPLPGDLLDFAAVESQVRRADSSRRVEQSREHPRITWKLAFQKFLNRRARSTAAAATAIFLGATREPCPGTRATARVRVAKD